MLNTGTIYRIVYSPTECSYATIVGTTPHWHHSAKRARLFTSADAPIELVDPADFHARLTEPEVSPFRDDSMARG